MAINCQQFEFNCNTTTGNQTIVSGLPFQPKGYILISFYTTAEDTFEETGAGVVVGFSDGTNSGFNGMATTDAETTSLAGRQHGDNILTFVPLDNADTTTPDGVATHSSFGADSIVINWSDAPPLAYRVFGLAFGGADLSVEVKRFTVGDTSTGNHSYTTTMSNPQCGFFLATTSSTTPSSEQGHGNFSLGIALSSTKRALLTVASEDDRTTMDTWRLFDNTKCMGVIAEDTGSIDYVADFVSWDANGFTLNITDASSAAGNIFYAMVLKGANFDLGTVSKRTSTGDTVVTPSGVGTLKGLLLFSDNTTVSSTVQTHNRVSIGCASSASSEGGGWMGDTDNSSDSIVARRSSNSNILTMATEAATVASSTLEAVASVTDMGTNTFTLNYTTATAATADIVWWVIGESTITPLTVSKIHKYNILEQVTKSTIHKYNILEQLTKSSIHKYNILEQLLKSTIHKWRMLEGVSKSTIHKWNMGGILSTSSIHKYNILEQLLKSSIHKYNIEEAITLYTYQKGYTKELRAKIIFMTRDKTETYYTYDPFDFDNRPFNLTAWNVRLAIGEVGSFQLAIEDHNGLVDRTKIGLGVRVLIQVTKDDTNYGGSSPYQTLITGFVRRCRPVRNATGTLEYQITGYGSQIIFNERVVNFKRAAKRTEIDSTIPLQTDERMKAKNLFLDLLNATDILPLGKPSLKNTGGFSDTEIANSNVDDFIAQIGQGLTDAATVANALAEVTGAVWGVNNNDSAFFKYASSEHSGIIIKGISSDSDLARIVSYNMAPFEFEDSIDIGDGFANRLYVLNAVDTKSTASSSGASGSSTLTFNGIGQQFTATDNNITGAAFILSKVGNPTNDDNGIRGLLIQDNNGFPTGPTLASFTITFDQIETSKSTVFVNDIKHESGVVISGNKYWWVLLGVLIDDSNTVRWHHDNDQVTPNRISATLPLVDADPTKAGIQLQWIRSVFGPTYSFSTFSSIRHILTQSDDESISRYGLIEAIVDLPAFEDDYTFQKALYKIIQFSAKPKRLYQYNTLTIPFGKVFLPAQLVTVIDDKSDLTEQKNVLAEIQEVNYNFDSSNNSMGVKYVDIRLMGFVDAEIEEALDNLDC